LSCSKPISGGGGGKY